jgi:hypothetical protein
VGGVAISVARGVAAALSKQLPALQVLCGPADLENARAALSAASADILAMDGGSLAGADVGGGAISGPSAVSEPIVLPAGPVFFFDPGQTSRRLLRTIPALLAVQLEQHGVRDAVISVPRTVGPGSSGSPPDNGVTLWMVGRRDLATARACRGAVDRAGLSWMYDRLAEEAPDKPPTGELSVGAARITATRQTAATVVDDPALLVATLWDTADEQAARQRFRLVTFYNQPPGHRAVSCGIGGPALTDDDLLAGAVTLRDLGESLAAYLCWAAVEISAVARWRPRVTGLSIHVPEAVTDDAFWWQLLGPRHRERLGESLPVGQDAGAGMTGIQIGDPEDWLPNSPTRAIVHEQARAALQPLVSYTRADIITDLALSSARAVGAR